MKKVFGVLAGRDMGDDLLDAWARSADLVVAADGAADHLLALGLMPDAIVGDMDSIRDLAAFPEAVIHRDEDENRTDCDKLLDYVAGLGGVAFTLGGIEGDRMDHSLASWISVARSVLEPRIALRHGLGWLVKPGKPVRADCQPQALVSLLPLADSAGVWLEGVQWPVQGGSLAWHGLVSISNRALGSEISAHIESGLAVLIVEYPRDSLPWW